MDAVTPPAVKHGDEVAVLAPSAQVPKSIVDRGIHRLRETFDVSPVCYPSVTADGRLSPAERAVEFHQAFESDATAVFAVAGGNDQMRLLQYLDLARLRANPTRFFGISDNTNLHLALSAAGLVSYYGCQFVPGLSCDPTLPEYTQRYLQQALFEDTLSEVAPAEMWTDDYYDFDTDTARDWESNPGWTWEFPNDDDITGPVWGGCLVVLEHFLAVDRITPNLSEGFVLALETSELMPSTYWIKSVLRCLGERGFLELAGAVVVGRPKARHRKPKSEDSRQQYRQEQRNAILETCRTYNSEIPILFDLDFGHTDPQLPIPIGGNIQLNAEQESVMFGHAL